jgi:hypothetical protein
MPIQKPHIEVQTIQWSQEIDKRQAMVDKKLLKSDKREPGVNSCALEGKPVSV